MDVTVTIPDGPMSSEVEAWEDGQTYTFTVQQNAQRQFTALEAGPAEVEPEAEPEAEPVAAAPAKPAAKGKGNPAIALVIAAGRKAK